MRWKTALPLGTLLLGAAATPLAAAGTGPYSMTVLVDGVPAPEYAARGRIYLEALKGRNFSILLGNPTGERVAVALSVDGRNVIDAKRTSAGSASKWILGPGQTAEIPGWQVSGETARRFFFTETKRSYAKWLGDTANVGTIEAVFYRERSRPVYQPQPPAWREEAQEPESRQGGIAGGTGPSPSDEPSSNLRREAKARAQADAAAPAPAPKEADSYAATGIGSRTRFEIEWVRFLEDPTPAGRVSLRYEFRTELVALGILPREDNLYARDRGRGFEREYAPDPYRHR
ncbi:MAG: hypothetical protein M3167_04135 [Acidobacteriota bacterium]|nr:hypothetical protein [Acidobacteriota bacterium]